MNDYNRTGGFAFPRSATSEDGGDAGMTKRDWYAGMALAALAGTTSPNARAEQIAAACFQVADAMIAESRR